MDDVKIFSIKRSANSHECPQTCHASEVKVLCNLHDDTIEVSVIDNGAGFPIPATASRRSTADMGLFNIENGAASRGSMRTIPSWQGTAITISLRYVDTSPPDSPSICTLYSFPLASKGFPIANIRNIPIPFLLEIFILNRYEINQISALEEPMVFSRNYASRGRDSYPLIPEGPTTLEWLAGENIALRAKIEEQNTALQRLEEQIRACTAERDEAHRQRKLLRSDRTRAEFSIHQ